MKKIIKTVKYVSSVFAVLVALMILVPASVASAKVSWDDFDTSGDYYFDTYTPSYYMDTYTPSYYMDTYTPSYDWYDYSTPSYDYTTPTYSYGGGSTGGSGGYTYYPESQYVYQPTGGTGGGGYAYYPESQYVYTPTTGSTGGGYTGAPNYQYVYTSSSNTNTNTNTNNNANTNTNTNTTTATANNNNTNIFNPVNNNDARINLVVLGGGGGTGNTNTNQSLSGTCVINPSSAYVNQDVSFSASASGGSGGYTYSWTGDNGIFSSNQSFTGRFSYAGVKNATVTIRASDGQSVTRSCSVNIQDTYVPPVVNGSAYCVATPSIAGINQNVTWTAYPPTGYAAGYSYNWYGSDGLTGYGQSMNMIYNNPGYKTASVTITGNGQSYTANCNTTVQGGIIGGTSNVTVIRDQTPTGTPVSGIFLNQVPDTGISFGLKIALFTLGLLMWSAFGAYILSRKSKHAVTISKVDAFKKANMMKRGIIA